MIPWAWGCFAASHEGPAFSSPFRSSTSRQCPHGTRALDSVSTLMYTCAQQCIGGVKMLCVGLLTFNAVWSGQLPSSPQCCITPVPQATQFFPLSISVPGRAHRSSPQLFVQVRSPRQKQQGLRSTRTRQLVRKPPSNEFPSITLGGKQVMSILIMSDHQVDDVGHVVHS